MDRAQKLGRLQRLRRSVPHVSASALAAVLAEVERDGVPELHSRKHMMEATEAEILVDGPYGKLITEIELIGCRGQTVRAIVANPLALLCRAFEQGGAFTELVLRCHRSQPSTPEAPWTLILYGDEVVPGNQLSFQNLRKMWVLYYSLLELGAIALQSEDAWLILTALRSSLVSGHTACIKRYSLTSPQNNYIRWVTSPQVSKVSGGISQVYAATLKLFFGAQAANLATSGLWLRHPEGQQGIRIFAHLGMIVQEHMVSYSLNHKAERV